MLKRSSLAARPAAGLTPKGARRSLAAGCADLSGKPERGDEQLRGLPTKMSEHLCAWEVQPGPRPGCAARTRDRLSLAAGR